jgi:ribosomal protein S6E (S10)
MDHVNCALVLKTVQCVSDKAPAARMNRNLTGEMGGDAIDGNAIDLVTTSVHSGMAGGGSQDGHIMASCALLQGEGPQLHLNAT